jgi:glutathione synthase/RimK-type ligase-like ATP-grasp enzyme
LKIWIYTGGKPSNGAKELASQPGFKRLVTGKYVKADDVIVGWGTSQLAPILNQPVINVPAAIKQASNKYFAFSSLAGAKVSTVPWTANQAVAKEWQDAGSVVVARMTLTGHSGDGIIIVEKKDDLVQAPLYTKYIPKVREFRVHATTTNVIDTQQKVRDPDVEPKSWKVRSHANGFIFQRKNIVPSEARDALAILAVRTLGLDFGAVDIIEDKAGNFYVLEVNTAPGLEGQTIESYAKALTELANACKNA